MVNRESLPLIIGLIVPFVLVFFVLSYHYKLDFVKYFFGLNIIYYIILFPILLGFIVVIAKWLRED